MNFIKRKPVSYLLTTLIVLIGFRYFLQSDEKYLKRKTLYLTSLASVQTTVTNMGVIKRINKISSFLRFDVRFQGTFRQRTFKAVNLQEIKTFMGIYFNQTQKAIWQAEDLKVEINKKEKTGYVLLTVKGEWNENKAQCRAKLHWRKEKKWLIHNIEALNCEEYSFRPDRVRLFKERGPFHKKSKRALT